MEKKYLITYELKNKIKDYSGLYTAIKNVGRTWWHYLDSTWIVKARSMTPENIFSVLKPHIDTDKDYVFVVEITDNKEGWLPDDAWTWINTNE